MGIVTEKPDGLKSSNDLDTIGDVIGNGLPPVAMDAYLSFGSSPKALPDPPQLGDVATYLVKVECTGEGKSIRTDGEMRYTRKLDILGVASWTPGQTEAPPGGDDDQGELFDAAGNPVDEDEEAEQ